MPGVTGSSPVSSTIFGAGVLDSPRRHFHRCRIILRACVDSGHAVSLWGFTDKYTWLSEDAPLLLDDRYRRKPAYLGARDALRSR